MSHYENADDARRKSRWSRCVAAGAGGESARAVDFIREAAKSGAQIVCLPELIPLAIFLPDRKTTTISRWPKKFPGPSTDALAELAREKSASSSSPRFSKNAPPGVYHNTAAIIDADGKFLGKYRKMHIPDDPSYYEKFYFTPGDLGFQAWTTAHGQYRRLRLLGPMVSGSGALDRVARRGDSFLSDGDRLASEREKKIRRSANSAWETMQRSHAIANGCFVAAANRVGHEAPAGGDGIEFWGQSFICAPRRRDPRQRIRRPRRNRTAEMEWERVNEHRTHWPFLRDRRVDAYAGIEQRLID